MTDAGNGFGVSFLPNGDQRFQRPEDQYGATGRAPLQEAMKILSMRVPRVVGANPLAPLALMGGGGASSLQPGQLEQLMRTLGMSPQMQSGQGPMPGGGPSVGGAPSPFAATSSLLPTGQPGGGPVGGLVNVTAGGTAEPPAQAPPPPPGAAIGGGGGLGPQDDSASLWELARRQREGMGRISY